MAPLYPYPGNETRIKIVDLPLLVVGNTDFPLTWDTPMPDATYVVSCLVEVGTAGLGKITATLKQGTITPAGCTLTATNSLLVSLSAGARLHALATASTPVT